MDEGGGWGPAMQSSSLRFCLSPQAKPHSLGRAVLDALAAGMAVTCLLDFWRLGVGGIVDGAGSGGAGLPWLQ